MLDVHIIAHSKHVSTGELPNLEGRKSHRILWRFPGGTEGYDNDDHDDHDDDQDGGGQEGG